MPDWPDTPEFVLRRARAPACLIANRVDPSSSAKAEDPRRPWMPQTGVGTNEPATFDMRIANGWIAEIAPTIAWSGPSIDVNNSLIFPGLVDLHTHIDKGHIWPRASNSDGTHLAAQLAVKADREANWSAEDVHTRADFALRCAYAYGTVALRTHLDSLGDQLDITWPVFRQLRTEWGGRITLQASSIVPLIAYRTPFAERLADTVADAGGLLGGSGALEPDAPALIERVFDLAVDRNLDIDLHVDESGDPAAQTLRLIAQQSIRRRYQGRVTCGHCCSLAVQDRATAQETIALVAEAGLTVVSLPMVNLYLQGRNPSPLHGHTATPTWRGITLLHELRAAGVRVAIASDNTRDPFYGFGDLDLIEVFRESVRIGHLDLPIGDWPATITSLPADVMRLPAGRLQPGRPADLILFEARDYSELLSRPQSDRTVIRAGRKIDASPPSYRELDHLFAERKP